tara:strand:+ start:654 stop:1277 length:624 start_codon:yes stop_codon:yes gene_type:complete
MKTFKSYINEEKILELNDKEFDEYVATLNDKELEELTEFIGGIARTAKKVLTLPVTVPYRATKAVAKGVKKVVTSKPVKKTGSLIAKGAKASVVNKKGNFRFSTAGRADSAQAKLARLKKAAADRQRLAKAKAGIAKMRQKPKDTKPKLVKSDTSDKQMFVYHIRDKNQREGNIHARSQIEAQVKARDNGYVMPMSVTNKGVYDGKS